jgi:folate-binding protein YgfZ
MHNARCTMHNAEDARCTSTRRNSECQASGDLTAVIDHTDTDYTGYDAARSSVAVGPRGVRGWLRVEGADAVSFLHGVLTNDIASLRVGQWCYAAYLTPQGRMVSDMRVLRRDDHLALEMEPQVVETVAARFDASIFTERVEIRPGQAWGRHSHDGGERTRSGPESIVVCGPDAHEALAKIPGADAAVPIQPHQFAEVDRNGERLILIGHDDLGLPAVDVLGSASACDALAGDLRGAGAQLLGARAVEALRIEAGTPRFGVDMTGDTIPLEAGIEGRAISMTKGCYVGQEVIIRILHRGHGRVARRLAGLMVDGALVPPAGSPLAVDGREVGAVTSAAFSPRLRCPIAFGYLHRDFVADGTAVTILPAGTPAVVTGLPFPPP